MGVAEVIAIVGVVASVAATATSIALAPEAPDLTSLNKDLKPPPPPPTPEAPAPAAPNQGGPDPDLAAREAAARARQDRVRRSSTALTTPLGAPQSAQNVSTRVLGG